MRTLAALFLLAGLGTAQAQYPYPYPYPYPGYPYPPQGRGVAPPAPSPGSLAREMLAAHNAVRAQAGVPPLVWSDQLASVAQQWANTLVASRSFAHRPDNRYGENLYAISGGAAGPEQVVALWADEARNYDIRSNRCAGVCGHYTQLVWRATRFVGCGVASDPEREVWVCNYDPPGNYVGYRPY